MEAIRNISGPTRINGPNKGSATLTFPKSKSINPLKIVESDDVSDEVTGEKSRNQMDPYKELELYLARVNVSFFFLSIMHYFSIVYFYQNN